MHPNYQQANLHATHLFRSFVEGMRSNGRRVNSSHANAFADLVYQELSARFEHVHKLKGERNGHPHSWVYLSYTEGSNGKQDEFRQVIDPIGAHLYPNETEYEYKEPPRPSIELIDKAKKEIESMKPAKTKSQEITSLLHDGKSTPSRHRAWRG